MEGRAEEVVLVATGRRERRRPPACRRHTAKSNNGGVLQRRRRLVETCEMRLLQGVPASGTRADGRSRGGPDAEDGGGARCAHLSPIPRRAARKRTADDVAGELGMDFFSWALG